MQKIKPESKTDKMHFFNTPVGLMAIAVIKQAASTAWVPDVSKPISEIKVPSKV
jgi:hypothetical protein